jgi:hypothetical protein
VLKWDLHGIKSAQASRVKTALARPFLKKNHIKAFKSGHFLLQMFALILPHVNPASKQFAVESTQQFECYE